MTIAAIFCIGTGHDHTEDANVLVKLHKVCSLADMGVEGNHVSKDSNSIKGQFLAAKNGGWKWLNDGQNTTAQGIKDQSKANVEIIEKLPSLPDHVVLVGHSRGCICCLRIAAQLQEKFKSQSPKCHLFLIDPVKRLIKGTDAYNRTIHSNVKSIRVIAMEDEQAPGQLFKLMSIKTNIGYLNPEAYLPLPGAHGTATQVTGYPIGMLGYMLALEFMGNLGDASVPSNHAVDLSDAAFCQQYYKINGTNPIIQGQRLVNDAVGGKASSMSATAFKKLNIGQTKRIETMKAIGIVNRHRGSGFFINEDHSKRFGRAYPALHSEVFGAGTGTAMALDADLTRLKRRDPSCEAAVREKMMDKWFAFAN